MGLLGVVGHGDKRKAYDIVRALSTQILVSEVPEDLKVAFVYDSVNSKGGINMSRSRELRWRRALVL